MRQVAFTWACVLALVAACSCSGRHGKEDLCTELEGTFEVSNPAKAYWYLYCSQQWRENMARVLKEAGPGCSVVARVLLRDKGFEGALFLARMFPVLDEDSKQAFSRWLLAWHGSLEERNRLATALANSLRNIGDEEDELLSALKQEDGSGRIAGYRGEVEGGQGSLELEGTGGGNAASTTDTGNGRINQVTGCTPKEEFAFIENAFESMKLYPTSGQSPAVSLERILKGFLAARAELAARKAAFAGEPGKDELEPFDVETNMPLAGALERARQRHADLLKHRASWLMAYEAAHWLGLVAGQAAQDFALELLQGKRTGIACLEQDARTIARAILASVPRPGAKTCTYIHGVMDNLAWNISSPLWPLLVKCRLIDVRREMLVAFEMFMEHRIDKGYLASLAGAVLGLEPGRLADMAHDKDTAPALLTVISAAGPQAVDEVLHDLIAAGTNDEVVKLLAGMSRHPNAHVRAAAVKFLSRLNLLLGFEPSVLEAILPLTQDDDAEVRLGAVRGILHTIPARAYGDAEPWLAAVVLDPSAAVRKALVSGLSALETYDRIGLIRAMLNDRDPDIRADAMSSLVSAGVTIPVDTAVRIVAGTEVDRAVELIRLVGKVPLKGLDWVVELLEGIVLFEEAAPAVKESALAALAGLDNGVKARDFLSSQLFALPEELAWASFAGLVGFGGIKESHPKGVEAVVTGEVHEYENVSLPAPPPAVFTGRDKADGTGRMVIHWILSPDDPVSKQGSHVSMTNGEREQGAQEPARGLVYRVYKSTSDCPGFVQVGPDLPYGTTSFEDRECNGASGPTCTYVVAACLHGACACSPVLGPVGGRVNWFRWDKVHVLVLILLFGSMVVIFTRFASSAPEKLYLREIPGLEALKEAIGRATEMGTPVLYSPGLGEMSDIGTVASISILSSIARTSAEYGTRLLVPCRDPVVFTAAQQAVLEGCLAAGKPDAYDERDVFFVAGRQFAYAAAVAGMMLREKPGANMFIGLFYAEALLLAEIGASTGAIQIAATDRVTQLPFFITSCDYTLIGEELYAAGAYLGRNPSLLGTLKAQDWTKAVLGIFMAVGGFAAGLASLWDGWSWFAWAAKLLVSLVAGGW